MERVTEQSPRWEDVVTRLVAERGDALTRYAAMVSGSPDEAADLVQDALVKTFGRLRNGFSIASAEAYVRRAILNTQIDAGRRAGRWRRIRHLEAVPEAQPPKDADVQSRIDLTAELARLTPRERACLVLRYYEDLKVDDIAATLGLSSGAVKRYLSDGLGRLRISLGDDDAQFGDPRGARGRAEQSGAAIRHPADPRKEHPHA